jgi:hypothetical protein
MPAVSSSSSETTIQTNPWHYLDCQLLKRLSINTRHNMVAQILSTWATRAGLSTVLEPYYLFEHQNNKRPDVQIVGHGDNIIVDVTVVDPTSHTHVTGSSNATLHTAMKLEQRKITRYSAEAKRHGFTLYPFALETYGGWGPTASKLLKHIYSMADTMSEYSRCWSSKEISRGIVDAVAVAVQKGNAAIIQQGLAKNTPTAASRT